MIGVAVSGFFLVPVLTRVLTQNEYGTYVVIRANSDLFIYFLHFGLISTVSRLYFEYRSKGEQVQYLYTIITLFLCLATIYAGFALILGEPLWRSLSPTVPAYPYLWFCMALSFLNFFAYLSAMLFRVEERAFTFVLVQVGSVMTFLALIAFKVFYQHMGLNGLLQALVINAALSGLILVFQFRFRFTLSLKWEHVTSTMRYAIPIFVGYLAYFLLNRVSTIILQRYVSLSDLAVFGLVQQLSLIVTIAANAFGKSMQPLVFATSQQELPNIIDRSGKLYLLLIGCLVCIVIVFAPDIMRIAAPARYQSGMSIFMIMTVGNFIFAAAFMPDTILLYFKKPSASVLASSVGGVLAVAFGLILVPQFGILGAAVSTLSALLGQLATVIYLAGKSLKNSTFWSMVRLLPMMLVTAVLSTWLNGNPLGPIYSMALKVSLACIFFIISYTSYTFSMRKVT